MRRCRDDGRAPRERLKRHVINTRRISCVSYPDALRSAHPPAIRTRLVSQRATPGASMSPSASPPLDPRRWWGLAVLCLSLLTISVDNTILNVALPTLARDLHA